VKRLVVNADDLGRTPGINRGVAEAVDLGIVTSASVMVRWPAARNIGAWSAARPHVSLGIHVDLTELEFRDGEWTTVYCIVDPTDEHAVAGELRSQLDRFVDLVGRPPTHLDSHQHVHMAEPARSALVAAAKDLGVPLRSLAPNVRYEGAFYGQTGRGEPYAEGIGVDALISLVSTLRGGVTELGCHPGDPAGLRSTYAMERAVEVRTLCDSRVRDAIAASGVDLISFADLAPTVV
jgi:predicted glycoside hydrolase/deacetylase ChbG (UPF0249 family)